MFSNFLYVVPSVPDCCAIATFLSSKIALDFEARAWSRLDGDDKNRVTRKESK